MTNNVVQHQNVPLLLLPTLVFDFECPKTQAPRVIHAKLDFTYDMPPHSTCLWIGKKGL